MATMVLDNNKHVKLNKTKFNALYEGHSLYVTILPSLSNSACLNEKILFIRVNLKLFKLLMFY